MRQPTHRDERFQRRSYSLRQAFGGANYLTSVAGGGIALPRTGLIFYAKAPGLTDIIGLSITDKPNVRTELWALLFDESDNAYSDAQRIINIELSPYLNNGWELAGDASRGYALYVEGTAQSTLKRVYRYFGKPYWKYRKLLTDANSSAVTNFQTKVTLTTENFDYTKVKSDGADIGFYDATTGDWLPYWIESWNISGNSIIIVKVADISHQNYIYFGKSDAESESNGANVFVAWDGFTTPFGYDDMTLQNAASPLTLQTYDGSGQTVHPSVIYIPGGWQGYTYWMANTPYPAGDSDYENPSLWGSNDGETWVVPAGIINPIIETPVGGYNSDPELVYNDQSDQIYLYYRSTNSELVTTDYLIIISKNGTGFTFGAPQELAGLSWASNPEVSPAVLKLGEDSWRMYAITSVTRALVYRTSTDGITWSAASTCTVTPAISNLWHLDVIYDAGSSKYYIAVSISDSKAVWLESANGADFTSDNPDFIPVTTGWDKRIYRPSFQLVDGVLHCWYSGSDVGSPAQWKTGYTSKPLSTILQSRAAPTAGWTPGSFWTTQTWKRSSTQSARQADGYSGRLDYSSDIKSAIKNWNLPNVSGLFEFDFYDNGSAVTGSALVVAVTDGTSYIGIGFRQSASSTKYSYRNKLGSYTATTVDRSVGWHKFGIKINTDASIQYYIDDALVGSLTSQISAITNLKIDIGYYGVAYVDDLRISAIAAIEPEISLGAELVI